MDKTLDKSLGQLREKLSHCHRLCTMSRSSLQTSNVEGIVECINSAVIMLTSNVLCISTLAILQGFTFLGHRVGEGGYTANGVEDKAGFYAAWDEGAVNRDMCGPARGDKDSKIKFDSFTLHAHRVRCTSS